MMCKRLMTLLAVFLVLGLFVAHVNADLVGNWKFDEGAGNAVADKSGNGNDGTLVGGPSWIAGTIGSGALSFDGSDDMVEVPHSPVLDMGDAITIAAWINLNDISTYYFIATKAASGTAPDNYPGNYEFRTTPSGALQLGHQTAENTDHVFYTSDGIVTAGQWVHIAATLVQDAGVEFYIDGQLAGSAAQSGEFGILNEEPIRIAGRKDGYSFFNGAIDDVQIYNHALTAEEIQAAMAGLAFEQAAVDSPADGAVDVLRNVKMTWIPGVFANTHDVYLGTAFDDVNSADVDNPMGILVGQGLTDSAYDAGILEFGQTYYWRIDEVNGAPDNTVFKGEVWSFTVEPFSIPVAAITATASSSQADTMGPENTIGGIGLNALDQHSTEATDMWLSGMGDATPSIQYEFDKAYKLDALWVWNSNQLVEAFVGLGVKDVVIEYSPDGLEWLTLENAAPFAQATGNATYTANTVVDFGGVLAQAVKITVQSGYGMLPQYGLSEVRFLYIPTFAREAQPADGAVDVPVDVVLSWRAGREAATHEVYLGTDPADLALAATTDEPSFLAEGLDYDQTYYWQVVEINDAETPSAYAGPITQISTPAYGVVDDFDTHDDACNRIFFAWEDGLGHNGSEGIEGCDVPASNGNGGGSIVGNAAAPFAEQTIVYAGIQSMPLEYDNAFGASEAILALSGQNWAGSGIKSLSLYVFGAADNTGQLYLKINNTRVNGAPDISQTGWQPWNIDLSTVGGNLSNVTSLTLGIDGANAAGKLYIDSIRLYPQLLEAGAGALSFVQITSDDDCGISAGNTYTHALDFGTGTPGALINGVQFDAYNAAANGTLNFNRESSSGAASDHGGNGGHNVTGSLVDLLTDMYYNGNNAPGGTTTWTLSGLTAGQTYHTRIYTRQWGADDSRNVTFVFDPDGAGPVSDSTGKVSQDNATSMGFANGDDAYYINYQFTAVEGEDLVITLTQDNLNYSWHLYGLTNQVE